MTNIHIVKNRKELQQILKIREEVFTKDQNIPPEKEKDGLDNTSEHIILYYKNKAVGCARIRQIDNKIKLERVAILKKARRKNLGTKLVKFAINHAKQKKVDEIYIYAQFYTRNLYHKLGFKTKGQPFAFANIKHIEMFLPINPTNSSTSPASSHTT